MSVSTCFGGSTVACLLLRHYDVKSIGAAGKRKREEYGLIETNTKRI